jgi:hypothetical protein
MKAIEPEEYPDHTQQAEALTRNDHALESNHFSEPLEDLRDYSESYSMLMGLVTIETKLTSRSLTRKKRSPEPTDDLRSVVDDRT